MHIGFVSTESPYGPDQKGGIAAYLRSLLPVLTARGHQVTLVAFSSRPGEEEHCEGQLRVIHIKQPGLHWYLSKIGMLGRRLTLWARQLEWSKCFYRVLRKIHIQNAFDILECSEVGGLYLSRLAPVVIRLHGSRFVFDRFMSEKTDPAVSFALGLQKEVFKRARLLSSPSQFQAEQVSALFGSELPMVVIPNPLDDFWIRSEQRAKAKTKSDTPIILYVGRLAPVKGTEVLLRAFDLLQENTIRLVLIGGWQMPETPEFYDIGSDHQWHRQTRWLGYLDRQKILPWYCQSTIFVMPSFYETFCTAVTEAMYMGLPVIASKTAALAERIQDGKNGVLVPSGDPAALAAAIQNLINNPEERMRLAAKGQASVADRFTSDVAAEKTLEAYQGILFGKGSGYAP